MKKQDMKVGMRVAVGRVKRGRFAGRPYKAAEAYILVLPTGQLNGYSRSSTSGKVGLAYRNTHTGEWSPQWVSSVEILHGDWPAYSVEWEEAEKARDRYELERVAGRDRERLREKAAGARLEAVGINSFKYRQHIGLTDVEKLLALLDEARGTAETMRRECELGEDYPLPWEIDTTNEDEHLLTTEATT